VRRHNDEDGVGPIGDENERTDKPKPNTGLPPRDHSQHKANDSERRLHDEATLVGGFPLGGQGSVTEMQAGRLLSKIDVKWQTQENGSSGQSEQANNHSVRR